MGIMSSSSPPNTLPIIFIIILHNAILSTCLSQSQTIALFRIQRALEYPPSLRSWNRYTNFCSLPTTQNLSITCVDDNVTELTIVGEKPNLFDGNRRILSANFSINSLFKTLTRLEKLEEVSLVSLGLWGQIPDRVDRFGSLKMLNLSSNYLYGRIPGGISGMWKLERLDLGGNLLEGSVPDLSGLSVLEELDLGLNRLGPEFPVVGRNVVSLVLKNNSFRGSLTLEFEDFSRIERFDVSSNKLFGHIPEFLFRLPMARYLDLSGNSFSGQIPENLRCGSGLEFVDLSRNRLVGRLPECLRSNTTTVTVMYSWNCLVSVETSSQHLSSYCYEKPLVAMPNAMKKKEKSGSNSKLGLVLAIVGGVFGGALLMALVLVVVVKKMKRRDGDGNVVLTKAAPEKVSVQISPALTINATHMHPEVRLGMLGLMPYREFEMEELEEATNGFDASNLLQESSQVQLYRGWIRDGSTITIRCLKLKQKHSPQLLLQHMDVFSKLRHRHLVSMLGHCIEYDHETSAAHAVYLVFEHVSNGTLRSHLTDWRKREMFKWPQRIAAVIGVARGIQFLHTVTTPGIVGNDIGIENIMLDETLTAKIQNYNLPMPLRSKRGKANSDFSFGSMEENRTCSSKNGDKEDIYQLGLILMEVITGRPASTESDLDATRHQAQKILAEEDKKEVCGLADSAIHGTFAYESLRTTAEVMLNCLSKDLSKRPSVDDILWNLQYSVQIQDGCTSSENLSLQSYN